ncbi:nucleoside-diphosphate-sugar epimerase GsfE [Setomelanomma holmii]|uniref:Nucleoside-diphosphate-sugar epimerase GsfE n=1 Tax=Setomelanomma holmii TaxID=210430 RepID=A0A9P4HHC0_9PLEO|nr:nucleoside-diphosphate-sugar epimerase GsfE [Setomelanomma holmii]
MYRDNYISSEESKVAFVSGANRLSGNAIIEYLIRLPKAEFSRIIISSRSPLATTWQDHRVDFVAIDFLASVADIKQKLEEAGCHEVTHAYFTSYIHKDDFNALKEANIPLFRNFVDAIDSVDGKSLQRICLQTGGKYYGIHKVSPPICPCPEDLPRIEDEHQFYYDQEDYLQETSAKNGWGWNIIRPGAIVGYAPGKSGMSIALSVALYFITCARTGETARFGGNKFFWNCLEDNSYTPSIADMTIWATTHEHTRNEAFNHANGDVYLWKTQLHRLGMHYGVEVAGDVESSGEDVKTSSYHSSNSFSLADWSAGKREIWDDICTQHGGKKEAFDWCTCWFMDWVVGKAWPTWVSVSKAWKFGCSRFDDTVETWFETIRALENAGVLPKSGERPAPRCCTVN